MDIIEHIKTYSELKKWFSYATMELLSHSIHLNRNQIIVLMYLDDSDIKNITVSTQYLNLLTDIDKTNVPHAIKILLSEDMVQVRLSETDKSTKILSLSEKGKHVCGIIKKKLNDTKFL